MPAAKYQFVRFTGESSGQGKYFISITANYGFGLSAGFCEQEEVKKYTHALVYTDSKHGAIGLRFTDDSKVPASFKISHGKNSAFVIARSFFSQILGEKKDAMKELIGKYEPQIYHAPRGPKIYFIKLSERQSEEVKAAA